MDQLCKVNTISMALVCSQLFRHLQLYSCKLAEILRPSSIIEMDSPELLTESTVADAACDGFRQWRTEELLQESVFG